MVDPNLGVNKKLIREEGLILEMKMMATMVDMME